MALTQEQILEYRKKYGITPMSEKSASGTSGLKGQELLQYLKSQAPKTYDGRFPEQRDEKIARFQAEAAKAKTEANKANSVGGFLNNFGSAFAENMTIGTKKLGDTLGSIFATNATADSFADTAQRNSQTQIQLLKLIREKEAKGEDVTNLKRAYNSVVNQTKENTQDFSKITAGTQKPNRQVGGEILGTAVDLLSMGTYGKATAGMSPFALGKARPSLIPGGKQKFFSKATAGQMLEGSVLGYGFDVSSGLQGQRGEERQGLGSLVPGLGTGIGIAAPAAMVAIPAAGKAALSSGNRMRQRFSPTTNEAINSLERGYNELLTSNKSSINRLEKSEKAGKNPSKFLAEKGLVPEISPDGKIDTESARKVLSNDIEELDNLLTEGLKQTNKSVNLEDVRQAVLKKIDNPQTRADGSIFDRQQKVNNIFDTYEKIYGDSVPLDILNEIKRGQYQLTRVFDVSQPAFSKDIHYKTANTIKEIIEKEAGDLNIADFNKYYGDHIDAITLLEKINGNTVKGGRLSKYFARGTGQIIGGMVGNTVGGPIGTVVGSFAGDQAAQSLTRRTLQNSMISASARKVVEKTPTKYAPIVDDFIQRLSRDRVQSSESIPPNITAAINPKNPIIDTIPQSNNNGKIREGLSSTPDGTTKSQLSTPQIESPSVFPYNSIKKGNNSTVPQGNKLGKLGNNQSSRSLLGQEVEKEFAELQQIPKGEFIDNAHGLVKTQVKVADDIVKITGAKESTVSFTRLSLKHLSEKGEEGKRLINLIPDILSNPDEIRQGAMSNRYLVVKSIKDVKAGRPHTVSLEVTEKDGNIVVTAFQTSEEYLSDFALLWRTAGLSEQTNKRFPPSQHPRKDGGSSRLSALKGEQNQKGATNNITNASDDVNRLSTGNKRPPGEAFGVVAGFERDEEGNMSFNPTKAALGIAGMGAIKRTPLGKAGNPKSFQGFSDLSTKVIEKLKGRSTVSKQFISDLTNSPDLKQAERDLIRTVLDDYPDGDIPVKEFADKVQSELLPLERGYDRNLTKEGTFTKMGDIKAPRYESVSLPDELRGDIDTYREVIYKSPIKTSAGGVHFNEADNPNYFGHTRVEDMADNKTRRVIEVQSDLYQKGGLEKDRMFARQQLENAPDLQQKYGRGEITYEQYQKEIAKRDVGEYKKLQQYNDPTAHFRMIREEVKQAAIDGKTKLQFPTGETAMKIEGLGDNTSWTLDGSGPMSIDELKVGREVYQATDEIVDEDTAWIITDVLGDGKFKAIAKDKISENSARLLREGKDRFDIPSTDSLTISNYAETFDISGKVDTNNPIYKFYEKEVGKYLKNKYNAELVTDAQGVKWWEVNVGAELKNKPVEAFGAIAGLEQDEEGNWTFNAEKALAGVALMGGIHNNKAKISALKQSRKLILDRMNRTTNKTVRNQLSKALKGVDALIRKLS